MVPMADMLNARFESENAKLYHEKHHLRMVSTKAIKAGEQIVRPFYLFRPSTPLTSQ